MEKNLEHGKELGVASASRSSSESSSPCRSSNCSSPFFPADLPGVEEDEDEVPEAARLTAA